MLLCFGTKQEWHLIKFSPRTCLVRISKWLVTLGFKRDMNPRWTPRAWTSPPPWPRPLLALYHFGGHGLPVHLLKPRYWSRQLYGSDEPWSFVLRCQKVSCVSGCEANGLWQNTVCWRACVVYLQIRDISWKYATLSKTGKKTYSHWNTINPQTQDQSERMNNTAMN